MPVSLPSPQNDSQEHASSLEAAQKLIQGQQFTAALDALQKLLKSRPDDPEALYMSAVCLRYTQQYQASLDTLAQLKSVQPEHGRAHQEEG